MRSILWALEAERAKHVRYSGNRVRFRGGQFRTVGRWNRLNLITRGTITIERHSERTISVRYHLTFWEVLVTATTVVAVLFAPVIGPRFSGSPLPIKRDRR